MGRARTIARRSFLIGSTSMSDSFDKLRHAGAVARETLKLAASQQTGMLVSQLKTKSSAMILPDGTLLPLIGKPVQRLDIISKSTGSMPFGIDLSVEGMVHAAVRTNPRKGWYMLSYDATVAKSMRGVQNIIEIIIAVVADNTRRATQAVNEIDIEWDEAPFPAEMAGHWQALEETFTPERLDSKWRDDGDVDGGLAAGAVFEAEYRSPYVAHAPLEPLNAIITVTDAAVEVWTGHQVPGQVQNAIAAITGHEVDQVIFHNQFMGGSFGHLIETEHLKHVAQIANKMRGTPVKLTYTREKDFAQDFTRQIAMGRGRDTVLNGQVETIDLSIASPSVLASQSGHAGLPFGGADAAIATDAWNNPYAIPNYRMHAFRTPELAPTSLWRSVSAPPAGFIFDSFLDELIHEADADPIAERIRLMDHDVSRIVLETVSEMSSWGSALKPNKGPVVAFVESFGVPVAEVVQVTATDAGIKIDKVWVACDVGAVIDPINFENNVQGSVVFSLGHAINAEITYSDGMAEQDNYHVHEGMRLFQCPEIFVKGLENGHKVRGIGEPPSHLRHLHLRTQSSRQPGSGYVRCRSTNS
ncbi:MAG: isoquinoline 1-oxidoreductase beta subunit [Candidatus Azotimanducaceae bacterium]|jgi:isoquinoline 1-oxidoreductase beta subunit